MRMVCLVNHETKSVVVYSFCRRFKHRLLIEEELVPMRGESSLTHFDTNVSWRRYKKGIKKLGFTFPNLKNGY